MINEEKLSEVIEKWRRIAGDNDEMNDPEGQNIASILYEVLRDIKDCYEEDE